MGSSIEENINEIICNQEFQSSNKIAEVCQGSAVIEDVCGLVELLAAPHYGLTLTTDQHYVSPLTIVNVADNLCQWILLVGKRVQLHQVLVVIEKFYIKSNDVEEKHISMFVRWEDVQIQNTVCEADGKEETTTEEEVYQLPSSSVADSTDEINSAEQHTYLIMVHNVFPPFSVDHTAYCLAFISYVNNNSLQEKLWLILRGKQIAWRVFLVPNREYMIKLPLNADKLYFEKYSNPLNKAFSRLIRGITVMLHHKEIFPTLNSVELPSESTIYLRPNTQFSKFVQKFVRDPFSPWFSIDEADHANIELITIFGKVESIRYDEEIVYKSCYLCVGAEPIDPKISEAKISGSHKWINPWQFPLETGTQDKWKLPIAKDTHNPATMSTGVPGGMVQMIKLCDLVSGKEKWVYIKHSNAPSSQQLPRLSPGMEICISHLNRRCSNSRNVYYISTILSTLRILSCPYSENSSEGWGTYGLHQVRPDSREKIWGVLETFDVRKVGITARCTRCLSLYVNMRCSNDCSTETDYSSSAHAIGRIQVTDGNNKTSVEKVIIKDEQVRKLLFIPEDVWQSLLTAAAQEEIMCFINNNYKVQELNPGNLSGLLKVYCEVIRPKCKFYISVRKMASNPGEEAVYYCIHLEPFNKKRFNIVSEHVKALVT